MSNANQNSASSLQLAALIDQHQRNCMLQHQQQQQQLAMQSPHMNGRQQHHMLTANCSNIFAPVTLTSNGGVLTAGICGCNASNHPINSTAMSSSNMHGFECGGGNGSTMSSMLDNSGRGFYFINNIKNTERIIVNVLFST
jgi:hypothetical protein